MSSLNKAILIGRAGKDPELRTMTSGDRIASFSLATSETWRDKATGEKKEKTQWHQVVVFNEHLVKLAESYIRKGSLIYVEGAIETRKWAGSDGVDKYSTEIVLQRFGGAIQLLGSRADSDEPQDRRPGGVGPAGVAKTAPRESFDLDDEIPF